MDFKLNVTGGKVRYLNRRDGKNAMTSGDMLIDHAWGIILQNKPKESREYEGYPVFVSTHNNGEYFFSGEWLIGGTENALGGVHELESIGVFDPEYHEDEPARKQPRKRKPKDGVLE